MSQKNQATKKSDTKQKNLFDAKVEISENPTIASLQQLGQGNLPSNDQITQVLDKTKEFIQETQEKQTVPTETKKVLKDTEVVIEATKDFLHAKNQDESLQKFVSESNQAAKEIAVKGKQEIKNSDLNKKEDSKLKAKDAAKHARKAGEAALRIIQSMLTNGEFRMFLVDIVKLSHDLFLQNYKQEEQTSQQQQPIKQQTTTQQPQQQPEYHQGISSGYESLQTTSTSHSSFPTSVNPYQERFGAKWSDDTKNWKSNLPEKTKHELAFRFTTLLRRMDSNPAFSEGMRNLFDVLDEVYGEVKKVGENIKGHHDENTHAQTAYEEGKKILHDLSGQDPENLLTMMKDFARDVKNDPQMRAWYDKVKQLFNDAVYNPHSLDEYDMVKRIEGIIDEGRRLVDNENWRNRYQNILQGWRSFFEGIRQDTHVQKLNDATQNLIENFTWVDEKTGQRVFNTELIGQFRQYLIPLFHKYLEHIPLPPIQGSNDDYDFKFDNLNFSGGDILPDHIHLDINSQLDVNVPKLAADKFETKAVLKITDIRTKLEGVHFWFKRKSVPKISDEGIADVDLSGDGANLDIHMNLKGNSTDGIFHVAKCDLDIDKLSITIREAKHEILLKVITKLFQGTIKRQLETKVEESFKSLFETIEKGLNELTQKYSAPSTSKLGDLAMKIGGFTTTGQLKADKEKVNESGSSSGSDKQTPQKPILETQNVQFAS